MEKSKEKSTKGPHKWMDKYVLVDKDDSASLDRDSAVGEFHNKLPREVAEKEAYHKYTQKVHQDGAIHHLKGMKAAEATGNKEAKESHGLKLYLHLKALGGDQTELASKIKALADEDTSTGTYKFQSHSGDDLLQDCLSKTETKDYLRELLKNMTKKLIQNVLQDNNLNHNEIK